MHGRRTAVATVATALAAATPAAAFAPGTTTLLDRPTGLAALPAAGMTESGEVVRQSDMSADGRFVAFISGADGLAPDDDDREVAVWRRDLTNDVTVRVAATTSGDEAVGISDDGDKVCFSTNASLDPGDTDTATDVYVKDVSDQTVTWVSASTMGGNSAGDADQCAMSAAGGHVAFRSIGAGLDPDHASFVPQVYRHALGTATTLLVSRADTATGAIAGSLTGNPDISADGDVVVFTSGASNLDGGDSNTLANDIFVRRVSTHDTRAVSTIHGSATTEGNGHSFLATISADGNHVAFNSWATNLVPTGDPDSQDDIYRKTLSTNDVVLVSRADGASGAKALGVSDSAEISPDGSSVAFRTTGVNLDPAASDPDPGQSVYVRRNIDGVNPATVLASRAAGAAGFAADAPSRPRAISTDGDLVLFDTDADNIRQTLADPPPDFNQLYVRRLSAPFPTEPMIRPTGAPGAFASEQGLGALSSRGRAISDDGRFVAFLSAADALSSEDFDQHVNAFVRDTVLHTTTFVSRASGATGTRANASAVAVAISADGKRVAFQTAATNLETDQTQGRVKLYVRDLTTHATTLVSVADDGTPADADATEPALDADGSRVAFSTTATNLGDGDTDATRDIHLRDLATGDTLLVSRAADGAKADQASRDPAVSADGSRVAFVTSAGNLGDGDSDSNEDVHVRDLATPTTLWASRADGTGLTPMTGGSFRPSISADGNRVAFGSDADSFGDGDTDGIEDIHVRDLAANTTKLVSRATGATGAKGDARSSGARISSDGKAVVFTSDATNLSADDTHPFGDVYLRRLDTDETLYVSRADGAGSGPIGDAFAAFVNGDGSCVAFDARTTSPPDGASPDFPHVFLRTLSLDCNRPVAPGGNNGGTNTCAGNTGGGNTGGGDPPKTPATPPATTPTTPPASPPARILPPAPPRLPALDPKRTFSVPRACTSRRRLRIGLRLPAGARLASVAATLNGRRARSSRRGARIDLSGLPRGRVTVRITVRLADGRRATAGKTYRACGRRRR